MKNLLHYFIFYSGVLQFFAVFALQRDVMPNETGKNIIHLDTATFDQDYGPEGRDEPVKLTLLKGMQPGSLVSFITRSENKGTLDICDENDKILFQMDLRFQNDILHLNSKINEESGDNLPNPVVKCAKTTTTIVYQDEGYRIFINGKSIAFFKHRSDTPVNYIHIAYDKLYKLYYLTTDIVNK